MMRPMAGEGIEALGEAVSGAVAAQAVEPHSAGDGQGHAHGEGKCLNCGCDLVGAYCHCCGQAGHVHRTLAAWWHDLLHGVLHFDGNIWRTLPLLAWHPGRLTRRYIEGERAKFVSPLALFLFSVFMMFALMSLTGGQVGGTRNLDDVRAAVAEARSRVEALEARRAEAVEAGKDVAAIDAELRGAQTELAVSSRIAEFSVGGGGVPDLPKVEVNTGWERFDKGVEKAAANPSLLFYKLQSNAYKFSWALIPLSLPLLWLLFLHRRRYRAYHAYDHVVFITYSIAFMSLLLIAMVLLGRIGPGGGWAGLLMVAVPPVHMYRQLRGAYRLSAASALWRTAALLVFAVCAVSLFLLLLLAAGTLG